MMKHGQQRRHGKQEINPSDASQGAQPTGRHSRVACLSGFSVLCVVRIIFLPRVGPVPVFHVLTL